MDQEKMNKMSELVAKQLELNNEFSKKFVNEALMAIQRFDEKQTEKGLGDYTEWGPVGVAMKMSDKFTALKAHYAGKVKLDDVSKVWLDCAVYSLMGNLVERGEWSE